MIREVFTTPNPLAWMAMFGFIALFAATIVYAVTDRRRGHLSHMEHLPLEDERHG